MKRVSTILAITFAAIWLIGCQPAANTTNTANTNTNTAKPAAAPPTVDSLMAMEKAANEAWAKSEAKWFQDNLSDKFVMYMNGMRMDKDTAIKMITSSKCDVKKMDLTEPQMAKISDDMYLSTYKGTFEGECTMDGKTEKLPTLVRGASVYTRSGDKWPAVWHGENPIIDPKAPAAPAKDEEKKKADAPKTDDKPAANPNSASNSNTAAPAAPAKSANTDALAKLHLGGWEAWKNKDAKFFEANMTSGFVFIDPLGGYHGNKAETIKFWTEGMKCEGITKVGFTDAVATAVSPTVEILTGKGTADGTCDGQKNGDLYTSAIYVKEGDAWKLAFMHESFPTPGM